MSDSLIDQFAIEQLLYCYAAAADARDGEAYCGCFVDGQVRIRGRYEISDGHEVVRLLREYYPWTLHNVHNCLYRVEGDHASGFCYCVASHAMWRDGKPYKLDLYIRYDDELQRTAQGWRFLSRHLDVLAETMVALEPQ